MHYKGNREPFETPTGPASETKIIASNEICEMMRWLIIMSASLLTAEAEVQIELHCIIIRLMGEDRLRLDLFSIQHM